VLPTPIGRGRLQSYCRRGRHIRTARGPNVVQFWADPGRSERTSAAL